MRAMKQIMMAAWLIMLGCFFVHGYPNVSSGPFTGGGSGGTTINNTYVVTNVPSGWQLIASGSLTNATITGNNYTINSASTYVMGNQSGTNQTFISAGNYYLQAWAAGLGGGTNIIFTVSTNQPGIAQGNSLLTVTITTSGNVGNQVSAQVNISSNMLASMNVSANGGTPTGIFGQWSLFHQVPAGTGSLNSTNTVINNIANVNTILSTPVNITATSTNQMNFFGWGVAYLNTGFFWNAAFQIDGSSGAYTNLNNESYFLDVNGAVAGGPVWLLASNPPTGSATNNVWFVGTANQANASWIADNASFSQGFAVFPTSTNQVNVYTISNLDYPSYIHVYVETNGWTSPFGWVPETYAGNSLADALQFYGLGDPNNQIQNQNNIPYSFFTNWAGGKFELGPAQPWINPFYLPQGFTINNANGSSAWEIYGQGPNTCIVGDSNVLVNVANGFSGLTGSQGGPMPLEYIHNLSFCVSNYTQKAVAVNLYGNGYLDFSLNHISAYITYQPTNYYLAYIGGAPGGYQVPLGYKPGFVDLVVCGNDGEQWIHNNFIAHGAAGIVCLAEHQRIQNNEIDVISSDTSVYQNQWASNDTRVFLIGDAGNVCGFNLSLGAGIIMAGQGDFESLGDKVISDGIGMEFIASLNNGVTYGNDRVVNFHAEALLKGPSADIVVETNAANTGVVVEVRDSYDQQIFSSSALPIKAYSFNTNNYVLSSTAASFVNCQVSLLADAHSSIGALQKYVFYVNNALMFSYDPNNNTYSQATNASLPAAVAGQAQNVYVGDTNWTIYPDGTQRHIP